MPENIGSFEGHECSGMLRDEARSIVGGGASGGNGGCEHVGVGGADEAVTAIHGVALRRVAIFPFRVPFHLAFRVKLHTDGVGIEIVEKDLDLEEVLPFPLIECGGAESQT